MEQTDREAARWFEQTAKDLDSCALALSTVSPDRRLPTAFRDAAEKCRELSTALDRGKNIADGAAVAVRALERCDQASNGTIHAFCRTTAALCREAMRRCEELGSTTQIKGITGLWSSTPTA